MNSVKTEFWLMMMIFLSLDVTKTHSKENGNPKSHTDQSSASQTGNQSEKDMESRSTFLRITGELKSQNLTSEDRVTFKLRVDGWPNNRMEYTWYKDNRVISRDDDNRISIQNKPNGSRLRIKYLLTSDTGWYRCEASNGFRRVVSSAYLKVSFSMPPVPSNQPKLPQGKCEKYTGLACQSVLKEELIYGYPFVPQTMTEEGVKDVLQYITETNKVSTKCKSFAFPALCRYIFPSCRYTNVDGDKKAVPRRLCRTDCQVMKYDVCGAEFNNRENDFLLKEIFKVNCTELPMLQSVDGGCTSLDLPLIGSAGHSCYNDSGTSYKGKASVSESGVKCNIWPESMMPAFPELAGAHNYCRNPGGKMDGPWCYIGLHRRELCAVKKCAKPSERTDMVVILVPSIAIPFILGCIALAFCFCRKRNRTLTKNGRSKPTSGMFVDMTTIAMRKTKLPELNASCVHLLVDIGEGQFGKIYKAKILPNPQFSTSFPVAVKTLRESSLQSQLEEFQREIEIFSEIQHENVSCLKAVVAQPSMHCMIFEYTNSIDLHEYLVRHSPQADFAKPPSSASSHISSTIDHTDFIRMGIQIACGMEYLTSNNFIHRDLAARNILVSGNLELKISNLGVVRDSYLSCYYRSPQGGQMLPIRWMAPESLQCWQFSDKSAVWSFGVVLWEMFSFGMQPYCGYSNQEVLELIASPQHLTCPDQCPARIYSLMLECWVVSPVQRPQFKDLRGKLQGWDNTNTAQITSHLAHGIHRQLTNVMKEGGVLYNQYTSEPSSIGGSSGITFSSNVSGPTGSTPSPPPQYGGSVPIQCLSSSTFTAQPPIPPSVSTSTQQYFSSHGTANQQRHGQSISGPGSHNSRSSSSCASSVRDQFLPVQHPRSTNNDRYHLDNASYGGLSPSHLSYSGPSNRPLSEVAENEDDGLNEDYYPRDRSLPPPLESFNNLVVTTNPVHKQANSVDIKLPSPPCQEIDSSDMSTTSIKATSCDSGLPTEDVDNHAVDLKTPLMGRPPRIPNQTPVRGATPRKFV
ncbi:inactive tyrosine-protein kinase transmembrane receptor ROR1-like isoform X2 [Clavelina lepadiformis]|uniref:inactive tyrosine-protein kinase transmembrane receptor ROR1-like isoform X2 n=1 Tax=Clavelina lepadiformis TaxID=159417 RepID=UPI0040430782